MFKSSLNALKNISDCTNTKTGRTESIRINKLSWDMTALQWDAMRLFWKWYATLCFTFIFLLSRELVSSYLKHFRFRLCWRRVKHKNICLVKIAYASSLPCEVKRSCILQEVYITLLPQQLKEISVLTDFDLYSFQCLVSLSLLGSSIAIKTARKRDPWFKLQGMVPVYRMHTQSLQLIQEHWRVQELLEHRSACLPKEKELEWCVPQPRRLRFQTLNWLIKETGSNYWHFYNWC